MQGSPVMTGLTEKVDDGTKSSQGSVFVMANETPL